jgi:ketosteroid isomerase-like protein
VPRSVTALLCAVLLAAGVGCGQSDQEKAREVVQDYVDARGAKDYDRVCELYSDSFKQQIGATGDCPAFVEEQTSGADVEEDLKIVAVRVNGDRAMADLDVTGESGGPSRVGLILERQDGDWQITGLQ